MEIIFQKRSPLKKSSPNLLAATVAGHVPAGMDFVEAVIKETYEETRLPLKASDLKLHKIHRTKRPDNNCFTAGYTYLFNGSISDLKVEPEEAVGFEAWPISRLTSLSPEEKRLFIPSLPNYIPIFELIVAGKL